MGARKPQNATCPDCGHRAPELQRVTSRIFASWRCVRCGLGFTTDVASGKLVTRESALEQQQRISGG